MERQRRPALSPPSVQSSNHAGDLADMERFGHGSAAQGGSLNELTRTDNLMPHIAANARSYEKQSIGNGQCVAFVRAASRAPHTSVWKQGKLVKTANTIFPGTAIATFDPNGKYGSREDGTSHAAIFIRKSAMGIVVLDQWVTNGKAQPVHERTIRFNNSIGKKINNGDEYYVVE